MPRRREALPTEICYRSREKGEADMRVAMILTVALLSLAAAPARSVDDLRWLSGPWTTGSGEEWTEEQWMAPRGGMMLGTNRSGKGAKATGFEYMRIAEDDQGRISFWAS